MEGLVELDSLTVYSIVDNETDSLSSQCACCRGFSFVPEMAHLARRKKAIDFDLVCDAAHGLSLLLVAEVDGRQRHCLFDAGPSPQLFRENVEKLCLDLSPVERVVLSHYHIDHSGGLRAAIPLARPVLVDLYPENSQCRGLRTPGGDVLRLAPDNPSFDEIENLGGQIVASKEPHTILGGSFFVSGEIPRTTEYETGLPGHVTKRGDVWVDDPFILDERYVAAKIKGKGIVVFSACSHAGVVNVCRDARKLGKIHAVFGGFHLAGKSVEDRVEATVKDLKDMGPDLLLPGHCTGWRAKSRLADAFPSHAFQPAVVGGIYKFSSSDKI
ncbi:hypothetical protein CTAYLR_003315 [Chrysophaeum taylorii]|uniref:Metallo-beta-lactamase domain-containing protein n=1 Tax=Chrysophaeum taylorii TaxID=2483200 RepID=A0AAD7UGF0_9STRA|nr:hypothetical protein CTAYLR_003315 [Chrysophaeum taylorii]